MSNGWVVFLKVHIAQYNTDILSIHEAKSITQMLSEMFDYRQHFPRAPCIINAEKQGLEVHFVIFCLQPSLPSQTMLMSGPQNLGQKRWTSECCLWRQTIPSSPANWTDSVSTALVFPPELPSPTERNSVKERVNNVTNANFPKS